jgi:hypothetical protein
MVSGASMFLLRLLGWLALGALLPLCGAIYFLRASEHAEMIARGLSRVHPLLASLVAGTFLDKRTTLELLRL